MLGKNQRHQHFKATAEHGGRGVIILACYAATGHLAAIELTTNQNTLNTKEL